MGPEESAVPASQKHPSSQAVASAEALFARWAGEHLQVLHRVAYRLLGNPHDAEDVVQDTFRSAWVSRHLFDASRSERAWLLAILRRRVADAWRKRQVRELPMGDGTLDVAAGRSPDPLDDELSSHVQRALGRLPVEVRETLLLVVVGELTHQEAADMLGVPLGTVLSRVSRGRTRLRQYLVEAGDGDSGGGGGNAGGTARRKA
jgi:RNA polymerase sigma-70 factor (ECF subfamily)